MCIIRRCSINGSGTSANMNTPREQYAASSSINRLLHAPFYFLHSVLNGFSSLHISPSAFSLYFPSPLFHRSPPRSFRFLSSPSKMPDRSRTGPEFEAVSRISVRFLRKSKTLPILFSRCQICFFPNGENEIIII